MSDILKYLGVDYRRRPFVLATGVSLAFSLKSSIL